MWQVLPRRSGSRPSWWVWAILAIGAWVGCSGEVRQPDRPPVSLERTLPQDGGTLVRRLEVDVTTLNPLCGLGASGHLVAKYLFTPLVYLDEHSRAVPGLATKWTISADRRRYLFILNDKATFSDGTRVRARDVIFTLRKISDPLAGTTIGGAFSELDPERMRAVTENGAEAVEVVFHRAIANQLEQFAIAYVLPEHFYANHDFLKDFHVAALGSGPYTLVRRSIGKEIVLRRRAAYWREKPHIETIILQVLLDYGTAWTALKKGDIDESYIPTTAWQHERRDPALNQRLTFATFYTFQYNCVAWNTRHPLLRDPNVRRALAMGLPADAVARDLYYGTGRAITGPFTPDQPGYDANVPPLRYDEIAARRLLAAAGWQDRDGDGVLDRNGAPFVIELVTYEERMGPILKQYLGKIGVRIEIKNIDFAAVQQAVERGDYMAAYVAWTLDRDPDLYPIFHSRQLPTRGKNYAFYQNASVDQLIEDARGELDPVKRRRIQHALHASLAQAQAYSWAIQVPSNWGINKRVQGVRFVDGPGLFFWYPGELAWWLSATP
jgi:peptide/nickel transport system substrate-binding protein